ncbi:MAG: flippase-like domain-containing protein [Spirochaetes bacterium]|nr:flippase-like domain-containing protein [Spirochaetota bacterium]
MKLPAKAQDDRKGKKSLPYRLARAAALLGGVFLIYWFVSRTDLTGIGDQLIAVNVRFLALIGVTFIGYMMVTYAWKLSFYRYPGHISIMMLFIIRQIGESLAQINPTSVIAGEALKALLLKRRNIPYKDSIVSLTISRFLVLFSALALIMIGLYLFFDRLKFRASPVPLVITVCLLFVLLLFFLYRLGSGRGILSLPAALLSRLQRRFPDSPRIAGALEKLREVDEELVDFYKRKKVNFIAAFLLSFGSWLMGAMEFYLILHFLGLEATFLSCVAIEVGVMVFKALGAFVPGQIGIEEYASKIMLEFVNVPGANVWITVSILRRARQIFWIAAGLVAFLFIIRTTGGLDDGSPVYNT